MKTTFSEFESLLNLLVLHCGDNPEDVGLMGGETGIALVLACVSRRFDMPQLEETVSWLFDNISETASTLRDVSFSSGLPGIGWGMEFLSQHGFIPAPADSLCTDIDRVVMRDCILASDDFSLRTGHSGLWQYIWSRIQGNLSAGLCLPFTESYIDDWLEVLRRHPDEFPQGAATLLQNAVSGSPVFTPLSIRQFVDGEALSKEINGFSLERGLAGYIAGEYLDKDDKEPNTTKTDPEP